MLRLPLALAPKRSGGVLDSVPLAVVLDVGDAAIPNLALRRIARPLPQLLRDVGGRGDTGGRDRKLAALGKDAIRDGQLAPCGTRGDRQLASLGLKTGAVAGTWLRRGRSAPARPCENDASTPALFCAARRSARSGARPSRSALAGHVAAARPWLRDWRRSAGPRSLRPAPRLAGPRTASAAPRRALQFARGRAYWISKNTYGPQT